VLVSTLILRNLMAKAVEAVPGIDVGLLTQLGKGFSQLYATCVLAGIIISICMVHIIYDLIAERHGEAMQAMTVPSTSPAGPVNIFAQNRHSAPMMMGPGGGMMDVTGMPMQTPQMPVMSFGGGF